MSSVSFPKIPENVPLDFVKVSPAYRSQVIKVLIGILLFLACYLLALWLAWQLVYYGCLAAIFMLSARIHWITILGAAGIACMVIMLFIFMIKFLFKTVKDNDPTRVEIKRADHPALFEFIDKVCKETKAPSPKKVFLSPAVNACVFYNSSFLSMFFPVRKNLEIGLGLVNSLNLTEFKAILAHEFGHFSQSSTRLGSYTYRINRMIYNLVYDNAGWASFLQRVAGIHWILFFFAQVTAFIVQGIQWFFVKLYELIQLSYLALSREMEFHADLVAASVSGSDAITNSLYRVEFGQEAFTYSLERAREYYEKEKQLPKNFFLLHKRNISFLAGENSLELEGELPVINRETVQQKLLPSRISFKDLWATHPTNNERDKNAHNRALGCEMVTGSPWLLFSDTEKTQQDISLKLYEQQFGAGKTTLATTEHLISWVAEKEDQSSFHKKYFHFYEQAGLQDLYPGKNAATIENPAQSFDDLFSEEVTRKLRLYQKAILDLDLAKKIHSGEIKLKKFEFDGAIRSVDTAIEVYSILKKEVSENEKWLREHKHRIYHWFHDRLRSKESLLAESYVSILAFLDNTESDKAPFFKLYDDLITFYISIVKGNFKEDELGYLINKQNLLYDSFAGKRESFTDRILPGNLSSKDLFKEGYKKAFFLQDIRNPKKARNLEGLGPFIEDMQKMLMNIHTLQQQTLRALLEVQDSLG